MRVLSTYRLQLRGPASGEAFTFADAEKLIDYFAQLGVSHLYLSPILTAVEGSSHGYDVTDTTSISAELGGAHGFRSLVESAWTFPGKTGGGGMCSPTVDSRSTPLTLISTGMPTLKAESYCQFSVLTKTWPTYR